MIEWADKFPEALPEEYLRIDIERNGDEADADERVFTFSGVGEDNEEFVKELEKLVYLGH